MAPEASLLALFRERHALLEGHFLLSSGLHSPSYLQCALLLADPPLATRLGALLAERLQPLLGEKPAAVVAPALGGVLVAHEVARALGCRGLFTERQDGAMLLRRGFALGPAEAVVVVEDVITTGGSAREVIDVLRQQGVKPLAVGGIVNRSGKNPFEQDGLPLFALADVEVKQWKKEDCPLCKAGGKAVKPGSRAANAPAAVPSGSGGGRT